MTSKGECVTNGFLRQSEGTGSWLAWSVPCFHRHATIVLNSIRDTGVEWKWFFRSFVTGTMCRCVWLPAFLSTTTSINRRPPDFFFFILQHKRVLSFSHLKPNSLYPRHWKVVCTAITKSVFLPFNSFRASTPVISKRGLGIEKLYVGDRRQGQR